jgi:type I restriction enzyme M protein
VTGSGGTEARCPALPCPANPCPEGDTPLPLFDCNCNDLFKTLKELTVAGKNATLAGVVRGVFEDAYNYMKSGTLLRQVVNKLGEIDFNKQGDRHEFGEVYEKILSDLQNAGNAGEFYTPRAVTQFMVDQVDPKLGETVLDPACGTGGFLTCTIDNIRKKYVKDAEDEETLQRCLQGVEKKPLPHLLCVTNMLFHGIAVPSQIRHDNTLARPLRDYGPKDRVDVIVTKRHMRVHDRSGYLDERCLFDEGSSQVRVRRQSHVREWSGRCGVDLVRHRAGIVVADLRTR